MALPDLLQVRPFTSPLGDVGITLPGSKSLTNRVLLIAALNQRPITLTDALFSEDTHLMVEALQAMGFNIVPKEGEREIFIEGSSSKIAKDSAELFVGLAGTAARFLTALCAAQPNGIFKIDGVEQMRKRPMKGLIDALRALGADIRCLKNEGFFPIEIHARGLTGGKVTINASESSQLLSALLMVAPLAQNDMEITLSGVVRWPFVQMTVRLMEEFGQKLIVDRKGPEGVLKSISVKAGRPYNLEGSAHSIYAVEPDATAASYFLALPLVMGGDLHLPLLDLRSDGLQGDTRFADVLENVGLILGTLGNNPGIKASFHGTSRHGVVQNFREFSDTFLTLAAIAPLFDGPTTITGIAHTRKQETDRVAGMARELIKLGHTVHEHEDGDGLTITPNLLEMRRRASQGPIEIETYGDHRFAMSFAILGCYDLLSNGQPWLTIKNPACCAKTFPNFFDVLNELRTNSHLSQ